MTPIFGFLSPAASAADQRANASYAASAAGLAGTGPATGELAACHAPCGLVRDGLHMGLAGQALWCGVAIRGPKESVLLGQILDTYARTGAAVLDKLEGPFALAIVEPGRGKALLAVDRMGIERMTYAVAGGGLVFGESAGSVAGFPGLNCPLRAQALYDFLFMHMIPAPQTVYEGVLKLPPATVVQVDNGRIGSRRYWSPQYEYANSSESKTLSEKLHDSLARAVIDSSIDDKTGAFLSGGLDSSSIVGTLSRVSGTPTRSFTVGFGSNEYDELEFSRTVNSHFGCRAFEYEMSPDDIVDAFPRIAAAYDEPFGNSSAAPTFFCAKLAADNGINHLLAGDGGDELFGGNERYIRQRVFEIYGRMPSLLRHYFIDPLARSIDPENAFGPLRKIRSYVDQARIPLPERFETWNFMYREGGTRMLDQDFAASIDKGASLASMDNVWSAAPSGNLLEKMLWYDWHFTLADNDLRKVVTMCKLAGVRVSFPMLHPAVINLSNRVPPDMKIRGVELRSFFKNSMKDFLPQQVINKKKHGFGLPFGLWLKSNRQLSDLIYSHLTSLKQRHIIDAGFIDNLISQHKDGHASYFGYAIWDLAMLDAWLACHTDRTTDGADSL